MKRNVSEKSVSFSPSSASLHNKQQQGGGANCKNRKSNCFECHRESFDGKKRFLVSVSVLGSPGPFRFLVNEEDLVAQVIDTVLKLYAKEGRLPLLGSDPTKFYLYCANLGSDAMSPCDEIGSFRTRNFVLCKKPDQLPNMTEGRSVMLGKRSGSWKSWLNKSLHLKILSH